MLTVFLIQVNEYLRIASGPETMAALTQLLSEFNVIIDFAIKNDTDRIVLVPYWLPAAFEVDD